MSNTHAPTSLPSSTALELGQAWMEAFDDNPEEPEASKHFEMVEACLDRQLDETNNLDAVVQDAYAWILKKKDHTAAALFLHAILPQFESVTEKEEADPRVAFLMALPIIGQLEHAKNIASQAAMLDFHHELIQSGVVPQGSHVKWVQHPVSLHEASHWLADMRRNLLVAALEGGDLDEVCPTVENGEGVDRAELSLLVGVCMCLEKDADQAMFDPAFIMASPDEFFAFGDGPSDPSEQVLLDRRIEAATQASDLLSEKISNAGTPDTAIEEPSGFSEALCTLVGWSLKLQQLEEARLLGMSESDLEHFLENAAAHASVDMGKGVVSTALVSNGVVMGPYHTDWPWKSLPLGLVAESFQRKRVVEDTSSVEWHANVADLWSAVRPTRAACKMH